MRGYFKQVAGYTAALGLVLLTSAGTAAASSGGATGVAASPRPNELGVAAALQQARATGHPVLASALTTPTELVTARPDGELEVQSYAFPVRVRHDGTSLTVLTSDFVSNQDGTSTGSEQAYDPVQSGCPASHYDSASYPYSPVGYDNFGGGACENDDTDYALYRVGIPSLPSGASLVSASFQTKEVYTTSCTATVSLTTSWIGAISSSTGWPGPAPTSKNVNATASVGPDPKSCNTVLDTGETVAAAFNVLADMKAISATATNITFRLWENGNTNEDDHKQFSDNPDLSLTYSTS
jgi:hypothetical protein